VEVRDQVAKHSDDWRAAVGRAWLTLADELEALIPGRRGRSGRRSLSAAPASPSRKSWWARRPPAPLNHRGPSPLKRVRDWGRTRRAPASPVKT